MQPLPPTPPAVVSPAPVPSARVPSPAPTPAGAWIAAKRPYGTAAWLARHDAFVARARQGGLDVVFLGDSITDFFATRGAEAWNRDIAPLGAVADFGISGDRTQWLLWRVQHGELDGTGARVVVLMIGTNNLGAATPESVARGVAAIVAAVQAKLPGATIVLNALLPRGAPDDPLRAKLADVNARIAPLADGTRVRWLDPGPGYLAPDGTIPAELMPDGLHPSAAGYEVWTTALRPLLDELVHQ
jgi:lysophospholipase L1-like esterase